MMTQVKSNSSFINHSNCEVTNSMTAYYRNNMWTEFTIVCRPEVRMPQV